MPRDTVPPALQPVDLPFHDLLRLLRQHRRAAELHELVPRAVDVQVDQPIVRARDCPLSAV